jgi:hypothetical protein
MHRFQPIRFWAIIFTLLEFKLFIIILFIGLQRTSHWKINKKLILNLKSFGFMPSVMSLQRRLFYLKRRDDDIFNRYMSQVLVLSLIFILRNLNLYLKLFVMFEQVFLENSDWAFFRSFLHNGVDIALHVSHRWILFDWWRSQISHDVLLFYRLIERGIFFGLG